MQTCEARQALLLEYLFGLMEDAESRALTEHLSACAACRAALAGAQQEQKLLAAAARHKFADVRFEAPAVAARIETERTGVLPLPRRQPVRWRRWAVAAGLLLAILVPGWVIGRAVSQRDDADRLLAQIDGKIEAEKGKRSDIGKELQNLETTRDQQRENHLKVVVTGPSNVRAGMPAEVRVETFNLKDQVVKADVTASVSPGEDLGKARRGLANRMETPLRDRDASYRVTLPPAAGANAPPTLAIHGKREGGAQVQLSESLKPTLPSVLSYFTSDEPLPRPGEMVYSLSANVDEPPVAFFPEGGNLVAGVTNRVYVRTHGAPIRGKLLQDGKPLDVEVETQTANHGMGRFDFTPKAGSLYALQVKGPEGDRSYALPAAKTGGVALTVPKAVIAADEPIRVVVRSAMPQAFEVVASSRGRTLGSVRLAKGESEAVLKPAGGESNVCRITVRAADAGADAKPLAERLIYRRPAEALRVFVGTDRLNYREGETAKITVNAAAENDKPVAAVATLAVTGASAPATDAKAGRATPLGDALQPRFDELQLAHLLLQSDAGAADVLDLVLGTAAGRNRSTVIVQSQPLPGERTHEQYVAAIKELKQRDESATQAIAALRYGDDYKAALATRAWYDEQLSRVIYGARAGLLLIAVVLSVLVAVRRLLKRALPFYFNVVAAACLGLGVVLLMVSGDRCGMNTDGMVLAEAADEFDRAIAADGWVENSRRLPERIEHLDRDSAPATEQEKRDQKPQAAALRERQVQPLLARGEGVEKKATEAASAPGPQLAKNSQEQEGLAAKNQALPPAAAPVAPGGPGGGRQPVAGAAARNSAAPQANLQEGKRQENAADKAKQNGPVQRDGAKGAGAAKSDDSGGGARKLANPTALGQHFAGKDRTGSTPSLVLQNGKGETTINVGSKRVEVIVLVQTADGRIGTAKLVVEPKQP